MSLPAKLLVDIHTHVYLPRYAALLRSRSSVPSIRSIINFSALDRESFYTALGFDVTVGTVRDFGGEENPFVARTELGGTVHFWDGGKVPEGLKGYGQ